MGSTDHIRSCLAALVLGGSSVAFPAAAQQGPLAANDWLSGKSSAPANSSAWRPGDPVPPDAARLRPPSHGENRGPAGQDIATSAGTVPVGVRRLGATDPDAAGIISARQAGLPDSFWNGAGFDMAQHVIRIRPSLPASASLTRRTLEAQLPPPAIPSEVRAGDFFLARVDQLIDQGSLPSAMALLNAGGQDNADTFRRQFDIALLMGSEQQACARMAEAPGISSDLAAQIFCLAQAGDWPAAALLLTTSQRLNMISPQMAELLERYLDDSSSDAETVLTPPDPMTPLAFRLHEAIGQPLPTNDLPLKYAWSELDDHSGWKAQLEAGERLARTRALPASELHRLYTAQRPAASGGVWERAAAIQALDAALATGDAARIGPALISAHHRMENAGLRDSFATMIAPRLAPGILTGDSARLALWLRLWVGATELSAAPADPLDAAMLALATGGQFEALTPALGALAPIFAADLPPAPGPDDGVAIAPALYGALADADAGTQGDVTRAARGIQTLRQLGLIADARRVGTQIALDPLLKSAVQ
ncbi:MAG: hypothetical protein ACK5LJ_06555 [Paracoccus sp. (in: a-proteobacteria)]